MCQRGVKLLWKGKGLNDRRDRREVAINRNVRAIPLVSIVSLVPLVPKVAINRKVLVLLDYACPVARNLIAFVVLTIKNYSVSAVAVVYKLGRATLNHSVILVATC